MGIEQVYIKVYIHKITGSSEVNYTIYLLILYSWLTK